MHEKIPQTHQFVRLWYFFVHFLRGFLEGEVSLAGGAPR
jgi:hypothetical protein